MPAWRAAGSAEELRAWARNIKRRGGVLLFAPELPFKRAFVPWGYTDIPTM